MTEWKGYMYSVTVYSREVITFCGCLYERIYGIEYGVQLMKVVFLVKSIL